MEIGKGMMWCWMILHFLVMSALGRGGTHFEDPESIVHKISEAEEEGDMLTKQTRPQPQDIIP